MEDELEDLLTNYSSHESLDETETYVFNAFYYAAHFAGVLSNILIIHIICQYKCMRTKRYIILMNYAINDLIFLMMNETLKLLISHRMIPIDSRCFAEIFLLLMINCMAFMWMLITKTLVDSPKFDIKVFFRTLYGLEAVVGLGFLLVCKLHQRYPILNWTCPAVFIILCVWLIVVEVRCCINNPKDRKAEDKFWLNVVRIYTYCWGLFWMTILSIIFRWEVFYYLDDITWIVIFFIPCLLLMYIAWADEDFKTCLRKMFRRDRECSIEAGMPLGDNREAIPAN